MPDVSASGCILRSAKRASIAIMHLAYFVVKVYGLRDVKCGDLVRVCASSLCILKLRQHRAG